MESPDQDQSLVLLGYPDDLGIQKNGGRVGASQGPDQIRKWLYKMTPPLNLSRPLFDLGNLSNFESLSLKERHDQASKKLFKALESDHKALTFGGGHDYGYADGKAFLDRHKETTHRPLIINFDAHLDVRKPNPDFNSGTPFYRLRTEYKNFEMIQIGVQSQCNSKEHLQWCKQNNIHVVLLDDFFGKDLSLLSLFDKNFSNLLEPDRPCFVSVDIDGFSWAYAPGCSQSWPTGMEPRDFFPLFSKILECLDVQLLSIYEVSPPLDPQWGTSKLAAQIAHKYLGAL